MAKAIRTKKQHEAVVATWECSECEEEFAYYVGYPSYCPECGEEFSETYDAPERDAETDKKG